MQSSCLPVRKVCRRRAIVVPGVLPGALFVALGLVLGGLLLPRAGQGSAPPAQVLAPRELLALSPQAVSALSAGATIAARERLARALFEQAQARLRPLLLPAGSRLPPAVQLPLTPALQRVLALDLQRRAQRQEPVLVGVLLKDALKPLAAAQLLSPPGSPDESSAHLRLPAELTARDAAVLRQLCERAAAQWPTLLDRATVRLVAGVPFAALLSQPESVIYINPVVLALVAAQAPDDEPASTAPLPIDGERTLTYRSSADCAYKVQGRCRACLAGDAAECAAVRATLGSVTCRDALAAPAKLKGLCLEQALHLDSVAHCVTKADAACAASADSEHCVAVVDACIAAPASAARADGGSDDRDAGGPGCNDCGCSAGWAEACGHFGRQTCGDNADPACSESCSDCIGECNKGCSECNRDCTRSCSSCGQGCQGFSSQCNSGCADCSRSCNQCNSDCNQCGTSCNQCSNDCSRCSSDCNQCSTDCNQCSSDCNQCNSGCNDCSGQCNGGGCNDCNGSGCNGQCSAVEVRGRYPRFPTPDGPAAPPPPLARMLVGARATVAFMLPPILFLWWRRRLHAARRERPEPLL